MLLSSLARKGRRRKGAVAVRVRDEMGEEEGTCAMPAKGRMRDVEEGRMHARRRGKDARATSAKGSASPPSSSSWL